ncbi:MAG: cell division protein FtsZ [Bacteroidales bacterium]|nr:cell division protein FtsZ [Bacteroidales bacterium]MBQ4306870.1 cell division protein FtsZ [Bacteroidales bacterium]MBQ5943179.1 cell division protein FtsZ [Bacteroidales bacterium]
MTDNMFNGTFDVADNSNWTPISSLIKVIGVGGGGCNAVNYMFSHKIEGCSFIACNTDHQALEKCEVPVKIQLGPGLGAGTDPVKARNYALESQDEIQRVVIDSGTQMLFITAGMGGGTGTGASPVIAKMAKDKGILTVAVVTLPFKNEGNDSLTKAIDGIHELQKNVDSMLIINNEKLYEFYGNQLVQDAFPKTDEVLATAVRGIIEIINKPGYINVDFEDVKTMMRGSGMALMGCGTGTGQNRLEDAVDGALESPLLNDFDLTTAKNLLVNVTAGNNEKGLRMDDYGRINKMIAEKTGGNIRKSKTGLIWDNDPEVGDKVNITVIATGFQFSRLVDITDAEGKFINVPFDFKYNFNDVIASGETSIPETDSGIQRIDFSSNENNRTFHFSDANIPALIVKPDQSLGELEGKAAIRRAARPNNDQQI